MNGWLTPWRYRVPPWMVEAATERRRAGDWRGACAVCRVHVAFDLAQLRRAHGARVAAAVEEDLAHLVPDLLRWHFPPSHEEEFPRSWLQLRLATYGRAPRRLVLLATASSRPLRITLALVPDGPAPAHTHEHYEHARHLWDARCTDDLRWRIGGGRRTPFFHRDGTPLTEAELPTGRPDADDRAALTEWVTLLLRAGEVDRAWADAGIALIRHVERPGGNPAASRPPSGAAPTVVVGEARRLLEATVGVPEGERPSYGRLRVSGGGDVPRLEVRVTSPPLLRVPHARGGAALLPPVSWQPAVDPARIPYPEALHPLVRASLFPDRPDPDRYAPPPTGAPSVPLTVRVRCAGEWHPVVLSGGTLQLPAHDDGDIARERTLGALGGEMLPCVAARERWRTPIGNPPGSPGRHRPPKPLRALRRHVLRAVHHGDGVELVRLLDVGLDPRVVFGNPGRTLLHLLAHVDGPDAPALVRRLCAAGVAMESRDAQGYTPLLAVLRDGGSAALVRAFLDAGADPLAVEGLGGTALHHVSGPDAARIVPWLVAAGVAVEAIRRPSGTALCHQVTSGADPAPVRALLDVGADRTVCGASGRSLVEIAQMRKRPDLVALLSS